MKIELSDGTAEIGDIWKWKHEQVYLGELYAEGEVTPAVFLRAKAAMVVSLLENLAIDGKILPADKEGLGEILPIDFETLYKECEKIREKSQPKDKEKKS